MITLTLKTTATILNAKLADNSNLEFCGVSIDTRTLQPGNLYVAIQGAALDGHEYVAAAKQAGAVAVVVSHKVEVELPQILVSDTTIALGQLARYWRQQFSFPIVGITGSCGKTTTTQMTGSILGEVGPTLVPDGNRNNQWGVPLTLFRLNAEHRFAVIEMGADRPGEIKYLASIVRPDVAIITNVAPVHLQVSEGVGFGSIDGVFNEKSEIYKALLPSGTAIVCTDDYFYPQWQSLLAKQTVLSFGYKNAAVSATHLQVNANIQYSFTLTTPSGQVDIHLSSLGRHNIVNALAASAAALALEVPLTKIQAGLAHVPTVARRMIRLAAKKGAVLIDDSYNSNLKSALAVLEMLADHKSVTVAIFGDMREIGEQSAAFHRQVGAYAKQLGINHFYAYGTEAQMMAKGFGVGAKHFTDQDALIADVQWHLNQDTLLVVKGSLGMKMDYIVKALQQEQN